MDPASIISSAGPAPAPPSLRPPPEFPAGLRVLLVDDDVTCLKIIGTMLRKCLYDVTTCSRAVQALSLLRESKGRFDLVLSDVYMPDMDGFKLLEHIGLEMDLPVIMMSADDHKDVVMKGVTHGAVDYLIKPVRMDLLKNIWQHVVRKKKFELKDAEQSGSTEENDRQKKASEDGDNVTSASGGNWKIAKRKKENRDEEEEDDEEYTEDRDDPSHTKKPRVVWSAELHQQFMTAVNQLGIDKAVPKKILELMKVPGLTRENVASHLQKYRLYLRRLSGPQHQVGPYASAQDAPFQSGRVESFDLQALTASGQLLPAVQPGARRGIDAGAVMPHFDQLGFLSSTAGANASNTRLSSIYQMSHRGLGYFPASAKCIESSHIDQPYHLAQPHGRNTPLKVEEETPVFFNTPSLQPTRSLLPGATATEQLNRSLLVHMSQPRQQFSISQQHGNFLEQAISRGQVLNGTSVHDSRLSSTVRQQMPPEISNNISGRTPSILNTSFSGNQISSLYASVHQPLNTDIQNTSMNESAAARLYPLSSGIGAAPIAGSVEVSSKSSSSKGVGDFPPSYDTCQSKTQDWKSQSSNFSYLPGQQIGSNPSNVDSASSLATHQDRNTLNTCTVRKEILSVRTENEHEKVECISQHNNSGILVENSVRLKSEVMPDTSLQYAFYDDHIISNELMNVVGKQFPGGTEDSSELFDRCSLDNI